MSPVIHSIISVVCFLHASKVANNVLYLEKARAIS